MTPEGLLGHFSKSVRKNVLQGFGWAEGLQELEFTLDCQGQFYDWAINK